MDNFSTSDLERWKSLKYNNFYLHAAGPLVSQHICSLSIGADPRNVLETYISFYVWDKILNLKRSM